MSRQSPKIAVILSGCGHQDGAEIRESVLALWALDVHGAEVTIFAPDIQQTNVINHLTHQAMPEKRNVMIEAARIARGKVQTLATLDINQFDGLVLPGGYGVANNLSDLASRGDKLTILPEFKQAILGFYRAKKPIGAICISPAVVTAALRDVAKITVTLGDDKEGLIEKLGGHHQVCATDSMVFDEANKIASCSAYMRDDRLAKVAKGIEAVVMKVLSLSAH